MDRFPGTAESDVPRHLIQRVSQRNIPEHVPHQRLRGDVYQSVHSNHSVFVPNPAIVYVVRCHVGATNVCHRIGRRDGVEFIARGFLCGVVSIQKDYR